jgi:8-oxo-dGTP pyrophosphatase MutT (NUDIX family)
MSTIPSSTKHVLTTKFLSNLYSRSPPLLPSIKYYLNRYYPILVPIQGEDIPKQFGFIPKQLYDSKLRGRFETIWRFDPKQNVIQLLRPIPIPSSIKKTYVHVGLELIAKTGRQEGWVTGWRNEPYLVFAWDDEDPNRDPTPLFHIERAFARTIGVRRFSVHINGYDEHDIANRYWVGKRSARKSRFPSMLDQMVAGGLSAELLMSPLECAIKECMEEASIDISGSQAQEKLIPAGCVTRYCEEEGYMHLEDIFVYDFPSPPSQPKPNDGEVESFQFMSVNEILSRADEFKPDVLIVLADFFIRKGLLKCEDFQSPLAYAKLIRMIHQPFPFSVIGNSNNLNVEEKNMETKAKY